VEEAIYLGDRVVVMAEGGMIQNVISVDLDRPRHVYDEKFMEYRRHLQDQIQGEDIHADR
jgi:NitT/TauT family transport system ATP-binding protein